MNGVDMIAMERGRQMYGEGWDTAHDDEHTDSELAFAAATYCILCRVDDGIKSCFGPPEDRTGYMRLAMETWPWSLSDLKPHGHIRNLARAGALIAAEIDRLQRLPADPPAGAGREA